MKDSMGDVSHLQGSGSVFFYYDVRCYMFIIWSNLYLCGSRCAPRNSTVLTYNHNIDSHSVTHFLIFFTLFLTLSRSWPSPRPRLSLPWCLWTWLSTSNSTRIVWQVSERFVPSWASVLVCPRRICLACSRPSLTNAAAARRALKNISFVINHHNHSSLSSLIPQFPQIP